MIRIAVVLQGDASNPGAWSGVPAGVSAGLAAAGVQPVSIDARLPGSSRLARRLGLSWAEESAHPLLAAAGGRRADLSIRTAGGIDGAVMIGSGYSLGGRIPTVTFEDMTLAQALRQPGTPYSSLSDAAARRWRQRQGRNYARSRGCCVASRWAARSVKDDYGIEASKVHVVGFGHDPESQLVKRDWQTPRYLFIGVDWERKRGPAVLEAFRQVRESYPEATLDLIGGHPPVEMAGVSGHGRLLLGDRDGRERRSALLARATCLVLPSTYEPFGIAYLDAGSAGVPSIGTSAGGAPDAIGEGGIVVDPGEIAPLIEAMLQLADPEIARRLGERAFAHSSLFTWKAVAERLLRALHPAGLELGRLADFLDPGGAQSLS